jgi:glycosyltransferase involved in cell wall biosynthesis
VASGPAPEEVPQDGLEGFSRFTTWREPLFANFPYNLRLLSRAARGSSVVHINRANPYTASLAMAARASIGVLVVDMEDWDGIGGYTSYAKRYGAAGLLLTAYESAFPRTAKAVVVVSSLLAARMQQIGVPKSKITVIPNGFDPELFRPDLSPRVAREAYQLDGYPLLIYISNFWPFERPVHRLLLESFREVVRRQPGARLVVVGRGSELIRAIAKELDIERNVILTGFVPRADMPYLLAAADIAIHMISNHPFHQASSPMIIPEYMAMGKAIVAPMVGELAGMLGGGAGRLVEYGDVGAMASAVLELAEDDSLRKSIGLAAETRARRLYSYEVLTERLEQVYESVS